MLQEFKRTAFLQTTGSTTTTLWSMTLAEYDSVTVVALINVTSTTDSGGFQVFGVARRDAAGAAALAGASVDAASELDAALGAATAVFDVDTNDIRLRVTGIAVTNLNWTASIQVLKGARSA